MNNSPPTTNRILPANDAGNTEVKGEPTVRAVICLGLAAWVLLAIISPGGIAVAAATLVSGILLFGAGYLLLRLLSQSLVPVAMAALLALPAGLIVAGGLAQSLHHSLGQLRTLVWLIAVPALPGLVLAAREVRSLTGQRLKFGLLYVVATLAVGLFFYLPKAGLDSRRTAEGGIQWLYPDSAFHEAIAAVVANDKPPLRNPGYAQIQLPYHYGRHALAAALTLITGNSPGDCLARSVHWLGVAALLFAAIALGWGTAQSVQQRPLSGLLAIVLIFFLPSFPALVRNEGDSCSRYPQVVLPDSKVTVELGQALGDEAIGHYQESGSILWAGIVVLAVAALLNCRADTAGRSWRDLPFAALLLAVTGIALNGVAGVVCVGVVAGFTLIRNPNLRGLAFAAIATLLFRLFQHVTGLDHPVPGRELVSLSDLPFRLIRASLRGFFLLLSFQALCIPVFVWGTRAGKLALALFVSASLGLYLLFGLQGYPLDILAVVLAGSAAAPLAVALHSLAGEPSAWQPTWARLTSCYRRYILGMLMLMAVLLPLAWYPYLHHRAVESIYGFSILVPPILLTCGGLFWLLRRMERTGYLPSRGGILLTLFVLSGFSLAGWTRGEVNFVFDLLGNSVELDAGRVASLEFAQKNLPPGSLFATTHHNVKIRTMPERSYGYSALTNRYAFLEGWRYGSALDSASFEQVRVENEALFGTHDAGKARQIVQRWGITHLIVEPNQSLGFDVSGVAWLRCMGNPGTLKIFEVTATPQDSR